MRIDTCLNGRLWVAFCCALEFFAIDPLHGVEARGVVPPNSG